MPAVPSYEGDIFDEDVLLDPHRQYYALRELGPIVWLDAHQMFAVPRYAAARAALADPDTFCSGQGVGLNEIVNDIMAGRNLIMSDGPLHKQLRDVIGRGLTPRALRSMRDAIEGLATQLVAQLVALERFDAATDLARSLPLNVVPDLVGWPAGGREHLLEWASATFDLMGPLNSRAEQAAPLVQTMFEFAAKSAADDSLIPGSLGAAVIDAARRGELEPSQVPALLVAYIAPSLDTTISAIGSAVWLLASYPEQWAALKANPELIPNAFNEIVRLESPIRTFSRVATTDTDVDGYEIEAGARVALLFSSANRDERHFDCANQFDITRANAAEHLGFGYGSHGCAGQGLARLEAHAVLRALVAQVDTIELSGEPIRGRNNLICSWDNLPVSVSPKRGA